MSINNVIKMVKHESPVILGVLGAVGVAATFISVAKAAPKAEMKVYQVQRDSDHALTTVEKAKIMAPIYAPSIAIAGVTVACIVSSTVLSNQQKIGLTGAYIALDRAYKKYKDKIIELVGVDTSKKAETEVTKDRVEEIKKDSPAPVQKEETKIFYEMHYDQLFERSIDEIRDAMYYLNRKLATEGEVNLNDLYDLLALNRTEEGAVLGWSAGQLAQSNTDVWIDYSLVPMTTQDGMDVTELKIETEPFVDYNLPF